MRLRRAGGSAATPVGGPEITEMRRRHVREVADLEAKIFPSPWSAALYHSELALGGERCYLVALLGGRVVGYAGLMYVIDEGHVTTVGVAPAHQREKIATRLLVELVTRARARGCAALTLEVRRSNAGAQELYHRFGFVPAGIRRNYYAEVNEDALVMWAHGVDTEDYRRRLDAIVTSLVTPGGAR